MPITILENVEPLSAASLEGKECILIESDASRLLGGDLKRYCEGALNGRSFLVSGHRGAGKTTLITGAVLGELRRTKMPGGSTWPVLVTLHGPSLFPPDGPSDPAVPGKRPADVTPPPTDDTPTAAARDEARDALLQMILELHRATARYIALAYRRAVTERDDLGAERFELAAQLEAELFDAQSQDPARLREFWRRGGFLESGVLDGRGIADQGWRELLAVSGLCQAYRRISGEFSGKRTDEGTLTRKSEAGASSEGKDLSSALLTLLTGGLVGTGLQASGQVSGASAALLGVVSAVGAALTLKVSASRALTRTQSWQSTFIPDLRAETLDRVLPVLLERLRDAGLFPVFLVDELDKVQPLSVRLLNLVRHLKKLVAEKAFFCFLTDRDYFEEMRIRAKQFSYSAEYTYFSDRLFVTFGPADLHAYLGRLLRRPPKPEATSAPGDDRALDEHADHPFLPYVVLHRSQMHALDLHRELAALQRRDGLLERPSRVRTDRAYRLDLIVQIAVEVVLDDHELRAWLERDPTYRRLVHDALYYPTRRWAPDSRLDLGSAGGVAEFTAYLAERTGSTVGLDLSKKESGFLLDKVRRLAELLADPDDLRGAVETWSRERVRRSGRPEDAVASEVLDAVRVHDAEGAPLEKVDVKGVRIEKWAGNVLNPAWDGSFLFAWRWDPAGEPTGSWKKTLAERRAQAPADAAAAPPWRADADYLRRVDDAVRVFAEASPDGAGVDLTTLAAQFRVLPLTPAWREVSEAIRRMEEGDRSGTPALPTDVDAVRAFAMMLQRNRAALSDALVSATLLTRASPRPGFREKLVSALGVLQRAHGFEELDEQRVAKALRETISSLGSYLSVAEQSLPQLAPVDAGGVTAWEAALVGVKSLAAPASDDHLREFATHAWESWFMRVDSYLGREKREGAPEGPTAPELLNAASERPPGTLFRRRLPRMTITDWSAIVLRSLAPRAPGSPDEPGWAPAAAAIALGLGGFERGAGAASERVRVWRSRTRSRRPGRQVLLIHQDMQSRIETWLPSTIVTALAIPYSLAMDAARRNALLEALPEMRVAAFEMTADTSPSIASIMSPFQSKGMQVLYLYPDPTAPRPHTPAIVDPKGIEALLELTTPPPA